MGGGGWEEGGVGEGFQLAVEREGQSCVRWGGEGGERTNRSAPR